MLGKPQGLRAEPLGLLAGLEGESIETGGALTPLQRIAQVEVHANLHASHGHPLVAGADPIGTIYNELNIYFYP